MKHELFVEQPDLGVKVGVKVTADTELEFKNENVDQVLKDLMLKTILREEGTNGINKYISESHISIQLNGGEVLLFDENRGYYMPKYPMESIEDAIADIESLRHLKLEEE